MWALGMSTSEGVVRQGRVAQRRRKDGVRRPHKVTVQFSDQEYVTAQANAAVSGDALGAWCAKAALVPRDPRKSPSEQVRADLLIELMALRRQLTGVATNINQLAARANSVGEVGAETPYVVGRVDELARRVSEAVRLIVGVRE